MSHLPVFTNGQTIVVDERWRGLLWAAVPQRVIDSTADELITSVPAATVSIRATNRELPEAHGLDVAERKLLALKTCTARAAEIAETSDKLFVYRPDRWSHVNLGWNPDNGRFLGWYINFERPAQPTSYGLSSKDLVLDIRVDPDGSWQWKDHHDFETAIDDGLLDPSLRQSLADEADQTLAELEQRTGPFTDRIAGLRPHSPMPKPQLPTEFGRGGSQWTFPPEQPHNRDE